MFVRWKRRRLNKKRPHSKYIGPDSYTAYRAEGLDFDEWRTRYLINKAYYQPVRGGLPYVTLYAYLCESKRVGGKVQARTIAYLGSIDAYARRADDDDWRARVAFWKRARSRLGTLNLDGQVREKLEQQLAAEVAPPTDEETARDRAGEEMMRGLHEAMQDA